jgi:pimeloyl-ACP methyl ester carboxylesterase
MLSAVRAWRRRVDLAVGAGQLLVLQQALRRASGLTPGRAETPLGHVAYLVRSGRPTEGAVPIVCVHGFAGDKETWLLTSPWLTRSHPLLILDLPGHGASAPPRTAEGGVVAATPALYARAVVAVLDACGWDRALVVGNSLGGGVALRLAVDAPDRVAGLVLLDSAGPDAHRSKVARAWAAGGNPLIPSGADGADALVAKNMHKVPPVPRSLIRYIAHRRAEASAHLQALFVDFVHASADQTIPDELAAVAAPTLVVHGLRDQVISVATAHHLAAHVPGATLRLLADVGHAPQLEQPRLTAGLINRFAARLGPAGAP